MVVVSTGGGLGAELYMVMKGGERAVDAERGRGSCGGSRGGRISYVPCWLPEFCGYPYTISTPHTQATAGVDGLPEMLHARRCPVNWQRVPIRPQPGSAGWVHAANRLPSNEGVANHQARSWRGP